MYNDSFYQQIANVFMEVWSIKYTGLYACIYFLGAQFNKGQSKKV